MYCVRCQYDLAHLTSRACPECGYGFDPDDSATFLPQPVRLWPLVGRRCSLAMAGWIRRYPWAGYGSLLVLHAGIRAWGAGFLVMMAMIPYFEGQSGVSRTDWRNVGITLAVVAAGFYVSHALAPIFRAGGVRDRIGGWSYVAGALLSMLVFMSPLRP